MNTPSNLKYSKSHEWLLFTGEGTARIGITDFAQSQLGDIVFVNLPAEGDEAAIGESFADIESVKAVSDVYSPVSGQIVAVNDALDDAPELLNSAPYEAWIAEISGITDSEDLLDADAYAAFCEA